MATFGWVPGAGSALLAHSQAGDGGGKSENAATRPNTKDNATINSANSTPAEPAFVAKHPDNSTAFTFDVRYKLELLGEHFLEKKSETGNFFYGNLAQWTFGLNDNLDLGVEIVGSLKGAKVGFSKTKTYQTYTKENFETGEVYSGKTSGTGTPEQNIARRDAGHHMNDQGFGPAALDKSHVDSAPIRGREQQLIKANGGAKSEGGTSGNKINGISPSNSKLDYYLEAAKKAFGF
jgi:hypothetical protein